MSSRARIEITADDRGATKTVSGLKGMFNDLKAGAKNSILSGIGLGAGISAFSLMQSAVSGVFDAFKLGASELIEAEKQMAQTQARLRSTGGAANVTADQVRTLAERVQDLSGMDAEAVQEGQNLLLTFTNVRNEVGRGNDIFSRSTGIMADMSVALGSDLPSAAVMLGKALNDPIAGVTALRKAGVQLTQAQRDQIKAFVESGDILSAQKVILAELETQVGGSAEALGNTTQGKLDKAARAWEDFTAGVVSNVVTQVDAVGQAGEEVAGFVFDQKLNFGELGDFMHQTADRIGISFQELKDRVQERMRETGESFTEAVDGIVDDADRMVDNSERAAHDGMGRVADAIRRGGPVVAAEAGKVAGMLPSQIAAKVDAVRRAGGDQVVAFAAGVLEKQNDPLLAIEALQKAQETALTRGEEIARLKGQLTGTQLAAGLNDQRVEVRLAAQAARAVIVERLNQLGVDGYGAGESLMNNVANGIRAAKESAKDAARAAGREIRDVFPFSEPKDPQSPFRGITRWNPLKTVIDNMAASGADAAAAARKAFSRVAVPDLSGLAGLGQPSGGPILAGAGAAGGAPVVIQLQLDGRTVAEVVDRHLYYMQPAGASVLPRGS